MQRLLSFTYALPHNYKVPVEALLVTVIGVYRDGTISIININCEHVIHLHEVSYGVNRMIIKFDAYLVGVAVDRLAVWLAAVDYGPTTPSSLGIQKRSWTQEDLSLRCSRGGTR